MLLGNINEPSAYEHLLTHKVWRQALDWIKENDSQDEGDYEIDGQNLYASIQEVQTIPREQGVFERHFKYIDLHYCVSGAETIEWIPVNQLSKAKEINTEKDYALHTAPKRASSLLMTPGAFTIFFPEDAHMPKISADTDNSMKKIVVKLKTSLI